jgi:hypothetical protein
MPFTLRVDASTIPALIFGGGLIVISVLMGAFIWQSRRALEPVLAGDDAARLHANRQFRRRMQVSVMLGTVGVLIPLGDQLDKVFLKRPILFFIWVGCVLVLVMWMVLMALGDWLSTVTYSEIAKARLRFERRMLEDEVRRYHSSNNGHAGSRGDDVE